MHVRNDEHLVEVDGAGPYRGRPRNRVDDVADIELLVVVDIVEIPAIVHGIQRIRGVVAVEAVAVGVAVAGQVGREKCHDPALLRSGNRDGVVDVTFDYAGVVDQARLTAHQVVDEEGRTIAVPGDVGRDGVIAGDIASGRRNRIPYGIVVPDEVLRGRRASAGKPGLHLPLDAHPVRPAIPAGRAGDELQAVGAHELRSEEL